MNVQRLKIYLQIINNGDTLNTDSTVNTAKEKTIMIISGKIPIYQQIYNQYKNYIKKGILENGEKLPSVRSLAESLGINPNTVVRAFDMLEKDSYIKTIPKKGFYVSYSNDVKTNDDYIGEQIKKWKKMGITKEAIFEKIKQIYIEKEGDSDD